MISALLGKEDPEVFKHWHDWFEPKAKQPLWLKPNSPESLEKLMEVLDTAIKREKMDPRANKGGTR